MSTVKLVAISDTHGHHASMELPAGDVLVHAGDFSMKGTSAEVHSFLEWFGRQPHAHKVLIAGNHELGVEADLPAFRALIPRGVTFLHDSAAVIAGLKFYGSPWTPEFFDWAFMLPRGKPLREKWDLIPADTEILVTHGPPYGHGDLAPAYHKKPGQYPRAVGCHELLLAVRRVKPRLHFFGHIHAGHGVTMSDEAPATLFVNASTCDEAYRPSNPPIVLEVATT